MNTYDEDDWDDEPRFVKEEPDCFVCNDSGCGSCRPGRARRLAWRVQDVLRRLRPRRRRTFSDEPPF